MIGTRLSGVLPPGRPPRLPTRNSVSVTRGAPGRALRQLDHAGPMRRDDDLRRVVVEILADHEHRLAIAVAVRIGVGDVGGQGHVARHPLPEKTKLVAVIPDVVAGGGDRVLPRRRIEAGAAGHDRGADVRLALEDAERDLVVRAGAAEVRRRRHLGPSRRAWIRPVGRLRPGGGSAGAGACQRPAPDHLGDERGTAASASAARPAARRAPARRGSRVDGEKARASALPLRRLGARYLFVGQTIGRDRARRGHQTQADAPHPPA